MKASSIVGFLGALLLAAMLLVCGFAACCTPIATQELSSRFSAGTGLPYTHGQLVALAQATRDFTVDRHSDAYTARKELAQKVLDAAQAASAQSAPTSLLWTTPAKTILAEQSDSPVHTMEELARVSDRYALDVAAMDHLEDCNQLINGAIPYLIGIGAATLLVALGLGIGKKFNALALMLRLGPTLLLLAMAALGIWGALDFDGLFAVFHSLFFIDGTWTFNYDSLLISMYPLNFWMGMGVIWIVVSLGVGLICFLLGFLFAWKGRILNYDKVQAGMAIPRARPYY